MRKSLAPSQLAKAASGGVKRPPAKSYKECSSDSEDESEGNKRKNKRPNTGSNVPPRSPMADRSNNATSHEDMVKSILNRPFKVPIPGYKGSSGGKTLGIRRDVGKRALHDPDEPGALVLFTPQPTPPPPPGGKPPDPSLQEVHVVVDPILSNILRPHQREGVKFLWECVSGVRIPGSYGAIMADEMGLGKTLQVVTLVWTLLRQSPQGGGKGAITNAAIVAPSSLVKNWAAEFIKWLGPSRVNTLVMDGGSKAEIDKNLQAFVMAPIYSGGRKVHTPVLIISYETFRLHAEVLSRGELGIIICDEGHRLKNRENQTYAALGKFMQKKRFSIASYHHVSFWMTQAELVSYSEIKMQKTSDS